METTLHAKTPIQGFKLSEGSKARGKKLICLSISWCRGRPSYRNLRYRKG